MKTKEAVATALVSMLFLAPVGCGGRQKGTDGGTLTVRETAVGERFPDSRERTVASPERMRPEKDAEAPETDSRSETKAVPEIEESLTAEKRDTGHSSDGRAGSEGSTAEKGREKQLWAPEPAETKHSPEVFGKTGTSAAGPAGPVEQEVPVSGSSAETEPPATEPPVPTEPPAPVPEETEPPKPKSIYDQDFDIGAIRQELISIGEGLGLTHVTEDDGIPCTPDTCSWASPVTASASFQGERLKQALHGYVTSMPSMVASYGGPQISCFTIYVRDNGGGSYTFYFLY